MHYKKNMFFEKLFRKRRNKKMFKQIEREYEKDKKLQKQDIEKLFEWLNKQPHLPQINELQMILFLQSCYYSNELTKTTIDNYFTVKTLCSDIFLNRNAILPPMKEALNTALYTPLPKQTPKGHTIIFARITDNNTDHFNFINQLKYFDMSTILWLNQNGTSNGHEIVMDMNGVVFGHLTKFNPLIIKKFLYYLQEAMPLRLKGLHYFNVVPFMDKILALMKPFMKKQLLDVLHLHNNVDDLIKFIPRECLPQDYGGEVESIAILQEKVKQNLIDNNEFFKIENQQLVNESLRPGKPKNISDIFGVEGTFKKLELD